MLAAAPAKEMLGAALDKNMHFQWMRCFLMVHK